MPPTTSQILLTILLALIIIVLIYYLVRHPPTFTTTPPSSEESYRNARPNARPTSRRARLAAARTAQCNSRSTIASIPAHTADGPAPIEYAMGEYDGIRLKTDCEDCWKRGPALMSTTQNHTITGHNVPLRLMPTANDFPTAPTVDGQPDSPQTSFMFAYNQSSPECCPATYSTSTGCVCTTPEQRRFVAGRGGNNRGVVGNEY